MKLLLNIARFGLTLLVCFTLLELFLRTAEVAPLKYTRIDDTLGLVFRPNTDLLLLNEGFYLGGTNSEGYIGPVVKNDANNRVVLLGDSYVEAFQLFERDHFATLAQQQLQQAGHSIQFQNLGMSGFDLGQMYCRYDQVIAPTSPDLTVFFLAPEDFAVAEQSLSPMARLNEQGELYISYPGERNSSIQVRKNLENNFLYTSATFTLLSNGKKLISEGQWPTILFDKLVPQVEAEASASTGTSSSTALHLSKEAKAILERLKNQRIAIARLKPYPEALSIYLQQLGIPMIDLMPEVEALRAQNIDPQYWEATKEHGHYNQLGHKAISAALVQEIPGLLAR